MRRFAGPSTKKQVVIPGCQTVTESNVECAISFCHGAE